MKENALSELRQELVQLAVSLNANSSPQPPQMMMSQVTENEFVVLLDEMLSNVRSIDDLFFFFGKTFPDLRETLITHQTAGGASPSQNT